MKPELEARRLDVKEVGKYLMLDDHVMFRIINIIDDDGDGYVNVHYRFEGLLGDVVLSIKDEGERFILFKNDETLKDRAVEFFKGMALAFYDDLGLEDDVAESAVKTHLFASYVRIKIDKLKVEVK